MRPAIADALNAIPGELPPAVADRVARSSSTEGLRPQDFAVSLRWTDDGLETVLAAGSGRTARAVSDAVRSFIGPSYAQNRAPSVHLAPGTPYADDVLGIAGDVTPQVLLTPAQHVPAFVQALERMLLILDRRPPTTAATIRPLAAVLRDFEAAVLRGDLAAAGGLADEAWQTGRLSLVNRSFLAARILARQGDAAAVLDYARRHRLADLRLPPPVERDLVDALGREHLLSSSVEGAERLVSVYRERVAVDFSGCFRDHRLAASPAARVAWIAHYGALQPIPRSAIEEIIERTPTPAERRDLEELVASFGATALSADDVRALNASGEHAAVFAEVKTRGKLDEDVRRDALRRTTAILNDPVRQSEAAKETLDAGSESSAVFAGVEDWGSWLRALFEHPDADDTEKVLVAGANTWTERLRQGSGDLDDWPDLIAALAGEPSFRRGLPLLVDAVSSIDSSATPPYGRQLETLLALAFAIAEDPSPGTAGLEALGDIIGAVLPAGLAADPYSTLVDQAEQVYLALSSPPRSARWVVEVVRAVVEQAAPGPPVRDAAVRRLVALLLPDAARTRPLIPTEVWLELAELLEGADGLEDALPSVQAAAQTLPDDDRLDALDGKSVLVHTLIEAAATRARTYLEERADVKVWTDSSHVGGDALKDLASKADLVVFAARASKHAAFETIRPAAGDRLVYASGKGWSSIVTAVRDALGRF